MKQDQILTFCAASSSSCAVVANQIFSQVNAQNTNRGWQVVLMWEEAAGAF